LGDTLRQLLPFVVAVGVVLYFDARTRRAGLDPPGFRNPWRRGAGLTALALALALTALAPLAGSGAVAREVDFASVPTWQLFAVHLLLVAAALVWFATGFAGSRERLAAQVGLTPRRPLYEIGFGLLFGVGAWAVVLAGAYLVALALAALGGENLVPQKPPEAVVWLASRSVLLRAALAVSAGTIEELFFRGLLQPRVGLLLSTALFASAHLSYGQPFLLVGVTLLSLLYGLLVKWRQSLWAAMAAHTLFDLVQLLVVVPTLLNDFRGFWSP